MYTHKSAVHLCCKSLPALASVVDIIWKLKSWTVSIPLATAFAQHKRVQVNSVNFPPLRNGSGHNFVCSGIVLADVFVETSWIETRGVVAPEPPCWDSWN